MSTQTGPSEAEVFDFSTLVGTGCIEKHVHAFMRDKQGISLMKRVVFTSPRERSLLDEEAEEQQHLNLPRGEMSISDVLSALSGLVPNEKEIRKIGIVEFPWVDENLCQSHIEPEPLGGRLEVERLVVALERGFDPFMKCLSERSKCLSINTIQINTSSDSWEKKEISQTLPFCVEQEIVLAPDNFQPVKHVPETTPKGSHTFFVTIPSKRFVPRSALSGIFRIPSMHYYPTPIPGLAATHEKGITGEGVVMAVLGYGCDLTHPMLHGSQTMANGEQRHKLLDACNFAQENPPVFDWSGIGTALCCRITGSGVDLRCGYAPGCSLVVCQTTLPDKSVKPGATYKAINWLREKWLQHWKRMGFHNMVILIPYGGQYMHNETQAIYKALDENIIIVCAAGDGRKGLVFPAALGNVISIGMTDGGPSGREVDHTAPHLVEYSFKVEGPPEVALQGTAISAANACGMIALLVSNIHDVVYEKCPPPARRQACCQLKPLLASGIHPAVVRELLMMSSKDGVHNCHRGYGEASINHLLHNKEDLLLKIMEVFERIERDVEATLGSLKDDVPYNKISPEERRRHYLDLSRRGINVAVIDTEFSIDEPVQPVQILEPEELKEHIRNVASMERDSEESHGIHGLDCVQVIERISPEARICAVNDTSDDWSDSFKQLLQKPDIDVVSFSGCHDYFSPGLSKPVNQALLAGKIIVCVAGNEGCRAKSTIGYPARLGNVLVIGGRNCYYKTLELSSTGQEIDFLAPAVYRMESSNSIEMGTSYATPTVAGFIAMIFQFIKEKMADEKVTAWAENPDMNGWEWREIPMWKAIHNVYAVRTLLRTFVVKTQPHSEESGFGCVEFKTIFGTSITGMEEPVAGKAATHFFCSEAILLTLTLYSKHNLHTRICVGFFLI